MSFVKEESTEEVKRYSLYSAKAGGSFPQIQNWREVCGSEHVVTLQDVLCDPFGELGP